MMGQELFRTFPFIFCVVVSLINSVVLVQSSSLTDKQCNDMTPDLPSSVQQVAPVNYPGRIQPYLKGNNEAIKPGETVMVSITGRYAGMILQARDVSTSERIGSWINPPIGWEELDCSSSGSGGGNAMIQSTWGNYTSLQFAWRAPAKLRMKQVRIAFIATIIKDDKSLYYHKVKSVSMLLQRLLVESPFNLTGCGESKGCMYYGSTKRCFDTCEYILTYEKVNSGIQFEMVGTSHGYIAVGISDDNKMGDDDVYACVLTRPSSVSPIIQHYYNPPGNHTPSEKQLRNPIQILYTKMVDGRLECVFIRESPTNYENTKDLSLPHYIVFTYGSSHGMILKKHSSSSPAITSHALHLEHEYTNSYLHGSGEEDAVSSANSNTLTNVTQALTLIILTACSLHH